MAQNLPSGPGVNFKSPVIPKRLNIPPAPKIPELPTNIGSNVGNSLKGSLPSVPEAPKLPGIGAAPAVPAGEDPCSSAAYLKNKLKTMPLIGNMSLSDLTPNIDLDNLSAPKIPTMKEIGNKIGDGIKGIGDDISGAIKDIGDDVTGALEGLKPSNLLPNIKKEIGKVGRVALAGAIEDKMLDVLGPVKAGIGNRIKRSVKTNLMMAGIDEVANIIAGEPNIFDPCAGKDKLKANAVANVGAAQTGKIQKQMNSAIAVKTKQAASSSNRMARDLQNPHAKPALPAIGDLPPTPGGNPAAHETAVVNNDAAVDQVADEAIVEVAATVSQEQAKNDDVAELEQQAQTAPPEVVAVAPSRSGEQFPPVEPEQKEKLFVDSYISEPSKAWESKAESVTYGELLGYVTPILDTFKGAIGTGERPSISLPRQMLDKRWKPSTADLYAHTHDDSLQMSDSDITNQMLIQKNSDGKGDNISYSPRVARTALQMLMGMGSSADMRGGSGRTSGAWRTQSQAKKYMNPNRYITMGIRSRVISATPHLDGTPKVNAEVYMVLYHTTDNTSNFWGPIDEERSILSYQSLGDTYMEAYKNAVTEAIDSWNWSDWFNDNFVL